MERVLGPSARPPATPARDRAARRASDDAAAQADVRAALDVTDAELHAVRAELTAVRAALDAALADLQAAHIDSHAVARQAREQAEQTEHLRRTLDGVLRSNSWRLTEPLRRARQRAGDGRYRLALRLEPMLRRFYQRLPLNEPHRQTLRRWAFQLSGRMLRGTPSYQHWYDAECHARERRRAASRHAADMASPLDGLVIPTCVDPLVSIVMPVHGQLACTADALRAIVRHWPRASAEIIVVDDASPDESGELLARVPGLRLLRQTENEGFIRACNRGAREARGRYLLFLNNDTEVLPGWCDELIRTFDLQPRAGIVGAKLLYPDGALQEAGGIVWQDGSAWNYGRYDDPDRPEYGYAREVDYVSGAALAIPRELFQRLAGFDERYLPAYGEDSDLAFKVREVGRAVVYQPLAQVIHREGATGGTDLAHGAKAHQVQNALRLFERWRSRLVTRPRPGQDVARARDRGVAWRVLVLDHCTPEPDKDAGSITALNIMRLLQRLGCKVSFIPEDNFLALGRYTADLQRLGIECHYAPYVTSVEDHVREHGELYDLVLIFRFTTASRHLEAIRRGCPRARVVLHTSDLHFLRETREAELLGDADLLARAARTREEELALIRLVDATIVHSPVEQELLRAECPDAPVHLFGWAVDIPGTDVPFERRRDLVYLGGYQHSPNVDAVLFFVRDVFPLIRPRLPGARFHIVGSNPPEAVRTLAASDVIVTGFVPDLREQLDQMRVAVAPLRYGAGIKGKVVTTMSHGLPGVITSVAAEGLGLTPGEHTLVADDPQAIADAVVELYTDRERWMRLSGAGLDLVRSRFGFEGGLPIVRDLLDAVGLPVPAPAPLAPSRTQAPPDEAFECVRVASQAEYVAHLDADRHRLAERARIEAALCGADGEPFFVDGYCAACHAPGRFRVGYEYSAIGADGRPVPNWREHLVCGCGLNARTRLAVHVLMQTLRFDDPTYLMEQTSPLYRWLRRVVPDLVGSEFLGETAARGVEIAGIRHEDARRLTFADETFAHVLSFDVFEHVPDYRRAFEECARCLRPGGRLLFTVPFLVDRAQTLVRARVGPDGAIEHLLPPEWHADPLNAGGGILCFQHFGWDLLDDLRAAGFARAEARFIWSLPFGYLGGEQVVIEAAK